MPIEKPSPVTESVPESLTQKAAVGAGWSAIAVASRQVLTLAAVAYLARRLGPSAYGVMGMAATVTGFLVNFRDLGTAMAIIQRPEITQELLSTVFWANLGFGSFLCLTLMAAAQPIAVFFKEPQLVEILRVLAFSFIFMSAGSVQNALLARKMQFKNTSLAELISAVGGYIVSISCAIAGFGVWSLVWASITNSVLLTGVYWAYSNWRPSFFFSGAELRRVAGFSLNLSGFGLVNYFSRNADKLIVGKFLGAVPLGQSQMAYNLMMYPLQNVSSILSQVLFPAFARMQNDNKRFADAYIRSCMLTGLITFPIIAGLGVVADPLVRALLGPKWIPVIPIFQVLAPVGMFQSIQSSMGQIMTAKGRTDWMFRWGIYGAAVLVPSFLIGVHWGVLGVAIAYAIAYFTLILYPGFAVAFRLIDLSVMHFFAKLLPQVLITVGLVGACLGWRRMLTSVGLINPWIELLSSIAVGAIVYVGLLLIFRPLVMAYLAEFLTRSNLPGVNRLRPVLQRFATV